MTEQRDLKALLPLRTLQIGHGSFGVHLAKHLEQKVQSHFVTSSRSLKDFDLGQFDYIFLATNDSSLQSVKASVFERAPAAPLVHFSGFYHFHNCLGLHPVASFNTESVYNLDHINFVADAVLDKNLQNLFPLHQTISPDKKRDYHNFLSVTANALQLMIHNLGKDFEEATELDANLLKGIVLQSLELEREKGSRSFSGPWIRGEKTMQDETVANMTSESLKKLNEFFKREILIYQKRKDGDSL